MKQDLTTGKVWQRILLFALPIFGANLLQAMYGTVDLFIVGKFADPTAISAVSTGSMVMLTITCVITGLTMGSTVLIGQSVGMKDFKTATRAIASSIAFFVCFGVVLAVVLIMCAKPLSNMMNAPAEALTQTIGYLRICGAGILCIVLFNSISGMFRGMGDSRTPLILMAVATVCNIIGDYIFVAVLKMGASGAAMATVIAQGISVVCSFVLMKIRGFGFETQPGEFRPGKNEVLLTLKYGIPLAAQELMTGISFMVVLAILNSFGLVASAGVGVSEKICGLIFTAPTAFMAAVSAFSAQNVGAQKYARAKQAMLWAMGITTAIGLVMFSMCFFLGAPISALFLKAGEEEVVAASAAYLKTYSLDCLVVNLYFSIMGYLNGYGKTVFTSATGVVSTFLVRIPLIWSFSRIPGVTLTTLGLVTPIATAFSVVVSGIYLAVFESKRKKGLAKLN